MSALRLTDLVRGMTDAELQAVVQDLPDEEVDELIREWAKDEYEFYLEHVHRGRYQLARHTIHIARMLERVERGEVKRLMIFMPPRHSKSMTVSETFPSYFIGKNPERRVIAVAYGDHLAKKYGRLNRQKLMEYGADIFGVTLSSESFAANNWSLDGHSGGMLSAGIGGPLTGAGADLLLIDDPLKNRQEAESPAYREMIWSEWQNTLLTRLQPGGAVIIVNTRWHQDDLCGRLLEQEGDQWTVIRLPAEAEDPDDPLGRQIGEPLWPEFGFDEAWLENTKRSVGSLAWASLYQQRPSPPEGNIYKRSWIRFYRELPSRMDEMLQSWDMAFKDTKTSDYVVGQVWGRSGADRYLIDQVRGRMEFPATISAVHSLSAKWPVPLKLVEDKANGTPVLQALKKEIPGLVGVTPDGSKESRAQAVSPTWEAGNVWLPHPSIAPWIHDFIEELVSFPYGKHDDQVDAMAYALLRLDKNQRQRIAVAPFGTTQRNPWR